jgi:PAS domain S-box-containing protein
MTVARAPLASHLTRWLDALDVGVLVQDRRRELLYANRAARTLLGPAGVDALGRATDDAASDLVGPDGEPLDAGPVARVLASGAPLREQVVGIRHEGAEEPVWLWVDAAPVRGDGGAIELVAVALGALSKARDRERRLERTVRALERRLAEQRDALDAAERGRRAAEAELSSRQQLHASVFGVIHEGIVVHDGTGAVRTANPAAARLLGLSPEELRRLEPAAWSAHLSDAEGARLSLDAFPAAIVRRTGRPCPPTTLRVRRPDGEPTWLRVAAVPLEQERQGWSVVSTFQDITQRRAARLALEASRARLQRVTEAAPGVLFQLLDTGSDYRLCFVSARATAVLGVEPQRLFEDPRLLNDRLDPEDLAQLRGELPRAARALSPLERDVRIRNPEDEWRWQRIRALPERVDEGVLWSGVVLDVTDERRFEEHLAQTQRREAMGDLAAGVAHNFNNVLAAVLPNLEEARRMAPRQMEPLLDDALRACRGAAELVGQLLHSTRHEAIAPRRERVDVAGVMRDVAALCTRSFDRRIAIQVDVPSRPVFVQGRASELHQVFLNLAINARDALEGRDAPRLTMAVEARGDDVVARVADTGWGMPPKLLERLGEPFFTTKDPDRGTGLGLATVYATLREMGASVEVRSELGRGTEFELVFPLDDAPAEAPSRAEAPASPEARLDGRVVLIVDDEVLVRRALARQLRRRGAEVIQAEDGSEGLRQVRERGHALDGVLLDLSMPGVPGASVLSSIRTTHPDLPVVVLTGHVPDHVHLGMADAVRIKPADVLELTSTLAGLMRDRRSRG